MTYLIFFDIDNTLLETGKSRVSANTKKMIQHLSKREDVILGISTGRGPTRLDEVKDILKHFDALMLGNGCYIKLFNKLIYTNFLKRRTKTNQYVVKNFEGVYLGGSTLNILILDESKTINRQEKVYSIDEIMMKPSRWINGHDFESLKQYKVVKSLFDTYVRKPDLIYSQGDENQG